MQLTIRIALCRLLPKTKTENHIFLVISWQLDTDKNTCHSERGEIECLSLICVVQHAEELHFTVYFEKNAAEGGEPYYEFCNT